ncbi:hypothetical protein B0H12DRAFT_1168662, partial [Mycena haematopus]
KEGRLLETVSDLDAPAGGRIEAGTEISQSRFHAERRLSCASINTVHFAQWKPVFRFAKRGCKRR